MDSIIDIIDEIQDLLDACKKSAFSTGKISVDKEQLTELLQDIRLNIPSEIAQAKRISEKCEKIVQEAHNKANQIIKQAEDQAEKLIMDHEITRQAKAEAEAIVEDAREDAREIRRNAVSYADDLLSDVEEAVTQTLRKVEDESRNALNTIEETTSGLSDYLNDEIDIITGNRNELKA
ncbi:MAG: ATPase [Clostridiales bacterium]|nr:ATPase [Clostridiales bacterium]